MVGQWREIAQSFMLFDERDCARVRKSDQVANRTVVAQDRRGRLVVATTEGGYTLGVAPSCPSRAPLGLTHAMSMGRRPRGGAVHPSPGGSAASDTSDTGAEPSTLTRACRCGGRSR